MAQPRIFKYRDVDRCYRFRVANRDETTLFVSAAFKKAGARDRGLQVLLDHYADKERYVSDIVDLGYSVFHFTDLQDGRIGTSVQFNSMAERDVGIKRFMNCVGNAVVMG